MNTVAPNSMRPTKRVSALAKVVWMITGLVVCFTVALLAVCFRLNQASNLIADQAKAVREQNQLLTEQATALKELADLEQVAANLQDLRFWSADLCLTLKTESEKEAQAAYARLEPLLDRLSRVDSIATTTMRGALAGYRKDAAVAADAYTDGNRVLGNSLVTAGQTKMTVVFEQTAQLSARMQTRAAAAGQRALAAAVNVEGSGLAVIRANQDARRLSYAVLFGVAGLSGLARVYLACWGFQPFDAVTASLQKCSTTVSTASAQVASSSQRLAEGAGEQAASLEQTSAALEELTSMVKRNADAANQAKALASDTRLAAETGTNDMAEMQTAMADIKSSSSEIAKIIKSIDEIAFQTNLLALNAAVEAARAGDAGLGFAVVADEVRSLAQRSAQSAKETSEKIESAISKTERGVQISAKVAANFDQITTKTRAVDQYMADIAAASREQAQGVTQVSTAVSQADKVTQSNAACAEESASAADELNAQAVAMLNAVADLQQVVGRSTRASLIPSSAPKPTSEPIIHSAESAPAPARNGNGHHRPAADAFPMPAPRGTRPESASGDFKDF